MSIFKQPKYSNTLHEKLEGKNPKREHEYLESFRAGAKRNALLKAKHKK